MVSRTLLLSTILAFISLFLLHMIPGFNNILAIDKLTLSGLSKPFSMYLNFDKPMAGLILYITSILHKEKKSLNKESALITMVMSLICIVFLITPGIFSGHIKFDFKIPEILLIWSVNNLLLVCMAEEVIFRGFLQNKLKSLSHYIKIKNIHVFIASIIFGLAHFKGGIVYIILSSIAGLFYGLTYEKTNRIIGAMLTHFALNLAHIIFFTYPALA